MSSRDAPAAPEITRELARAVSCSACGKQGKPVSSVTLRSLVKQEHQDRITAGPYRFCESPQCETVYFAADGSHRFAKSDLTVRVGIKEAVAPRQVCYCFDYTIEQIEDEVRRTGTAKIPDEITAKCRQGLDRCEVTNPQGRCCLGNVRGALKEAQGRYAPDDAADAPATGRDKNVRWSAGSLVQAGAIVSALVASACCWLPLTLIAFGVSGGALAATFEQYRFIFLPLTFALLGSAFYFAYRKPRAAVAQGDSGDAEACCAVPAEGDVEASCCPPARKGITLKRFNKIMLWGVTLVVLSFAFFPNYVGLLLGGGTSLAASENLDRLVVKVDGMTCEGCAVLIEKALAAVPGVVGAEVIYEKGEAVIGFAKGTAAPRDEILAAITNAGYGGRFTDVAE